MAMEGCAGKDGVARARHSRALTRFSWERMVGASAYAE